MKAWEKGRDLSVGALRKLYYDKLKLNINNEYNVKALFKEQGDTIIACYKRWEYFKETGNCDGTINCNFCPLRDKVCRNLTKPERLEILNEEV